MNVLVTGGSGFIGSNLVHFLKSSREDFRITVIDKLGYAGNLENISALIEKNDIFFSKIDISDSASLGEFWKNSGPFDFVFHLAAESHVDRSIHSALPFALSNVVGTQALLDQALAQEKKPRFIHISTDEVYGSLGPDGRFYETTPMDPTSPYAASKASSDLMALAAFKTHGLDVLVTRCTNNYGPFQFPEKFIPLSITNAMEDRALPVYGDGMQIRSWLHVSDHCSALLLVAEKGRAGEVYNIGSEVTDEVPNIFVAKEILRALGKSESLLKHVSDRLAHDRRYAVCHDKITSELGWQAKVDFKSGLSKTIEWYQENREWWQKIKSGEYINFYQQHYGREL